MTTARLMTNLFRFLLLFGYVVSIVFIVAGVFFNPFIVKKFISPDGSLERITVFTIYIVDLSLIVIGMFLIFVVRLLEKSSDKARILACKFAIALFPIVVFLVAFELGLSVFYPQTTSTYAITYSPRIFSLAENIPWTLSSNSSDTHITQEFKVKVSINSLGLRDKEKTQTDNKKILIIGDSFTFGFGVEQNETYSSQLEKLLVDAGLDYKVWNAGYAGGLSPDTYYVYLKERLSLFKPEMVILGFFGENDITDTERNQWVTTDGNGYPEKITSAIYDVTNKQLRKKKLILKTPIDKIKNMLQMTASKFHTYILLNRIYSTMIKSDEIRVYQENWDETLVEDWKRTMLSITAIKDLLDTSKIPFVILLIPGRVQAVDEFWQEYQNTAKVPTVRNKPQELMTEYCKMQNITCVDLYPAFLNNSQDLYLKYDGHWNAQGHKLAADKIYEFLYDDFKS